VQRQIEALRQLAKLAVESPAGNETLAARPASSAGPLGPARCCWSMPRTRTCSFAAAGERRRCRLHPDWSVVTAAANHRVGRTRGLQPGGPPVEASPAPQQRPARVSGLFCAHHREPIGDVHPPGTLGAGATAHVLRFMESATPALTIILERFLNLVAAGASPSNSRPWLTQPRCSPDQRMWRRP